LFFTLAFRPGQHGHKTMTEKRTERTSTVMKEGHCPSIRLILLQRKQGRQNNEEIVTPWGIRHVGPPTSSSGGDPERPSGGRLNCWKRAIRFRLGAMKLEFRKTWPRNQPVANPSSVRCALGGICFRTYYLSRFRSFFRQPHTLNGRPQGLHWPAGKRDNEQPLKRKLICGMGGL